MKYNVENNLLGIWIAILHRYRKSYVNKQLEAYGFSGGQFIILLTISKHDGSSQEEISQLLKIDKTTAAKSIKKLEINGYVLRKKDPTDGRAYNVYLTQKALDIIPLIRETVKKWDSEVTVGLTEEECRLAEEILHKMADNACELCANY